MNKRIKKLRKQLKLTQDEFGSKISAKRSTIASWENGSNYPNPPNIQLICEVYGVRKEWLVDGIGEMFGDCDYNVAEFISQECEAHPDNVKKRLIAALSKLDEEGLEALEKFIDKIREEEKKEH